MCKPKKKCIRYFQRVATTRLSEWFAFVKLDVECRYIWSNNCDNKHMLYADFRGGRRLFRNQVFDKIIQPMAAWKTDSNYIMAQKNPFVLSTHHVLYVYEQSIESEARKITPNLVRLELFLLISGTKFLFSEWWYPLAHWSFA